MNSIALGIWAEFAGRFPETATKIQYRKTKGIWPDLKHPVLFDEKLSYLKLYKYANDPLVVQCSDKYRVREYVQNHNCSEILNNFYGVWEHVEDVPFDSFPNSFVIKCTHGCHMNIVCPDKRKLDISKARRDLNGWMKEKQWKVQQELHYRAIKPRIICEKYLKPVGGYSAT